MTPPCTIQSSAPVVPDWLAGGDPGPEALLLSPAQESLWFFEQMHPGRPTYHIPEAWRLRGPVDESVLRRALMFIAERHEILRTGLTARDGKPVQIIKPDAYFPLSVVDLRETAGAAGVEAELTRGLHQQACTPFKLDQAPLVRVTLFRLAEDHHVVAITMHHLISDAWSFGVFQRELRECYEAARRGRAPTLRPLPVQFADYTLWLRETPQVIHRRQQLEWWMNNLSEIHDSLALPFDFARPAQPTGAGSTLYLQLDSTTAVAIRETSRRLGTTPFMLLFGVFNVLLNRLSRQDVLAVGTPFSRRERSEIQDLIGFFVNTHAVKTRIASGMRFQDYLSQLRDEVLAAQAHEAVPFSAVVEALGASGSRCHPIFQTVFGFENEQRDEPLLASAPAERLDLNTPTAKFDLTLLVTPGPRQFRLRFEYSSELFAPSSVEQFAKLYQLLLVDALQAPQKLIEHLSWLSPEEETRLRAWSQVTAPYDSENSVPERFAQVVAANPDRPALVFGGEVISYTELDQRSNAVAVELRGRGLNLGSPVGIALDRCPELIISMLGILKAGGAYVPLDLSWPPARLWSLTAETGISLLIGRAEACLGLPESLQRIDPHIFPRCVTAQPEPGPKPNSLAYILFTSGSTGLPKAVAIPHRGIVRLVSQSNYLRITPQDVFLQISPPAFDASTLEIWGPLLNGGCLVLPPDGPLSLAEIGNLIARHQVTTLWLTAGLFHQFVDFGIEHLLPLKRLLAGGEELSVRHVSRALEQLPGVQLINGYGPTENTTFTTCFAIPEHWQAKRSVPIGSPIENTSAWVLDARQCLTPIGAPGELFAGGDGLALGYWNQHDLNEAKFLTNPVQPGQTMYATGDLVRWLPDGTLEFLGRVDDQVKVRGYRVEPGEVQCMMEKSPWVHSALVVARPDSSGSRQLVGYYVPRNGGAKVEELRRWLECRLPGHLVPSSLVPLSAFPLNQNGKIDRKALPDPGLVAPPSVSEPPANDAEQLVARIFAEVLGRAKIGRHDHFFRMGGHSLLATQVIARIARDLGRELPVSSIFEYPTVAGLASILGTQASSSHSRILSHLTASQARELLERVHELSPEEVDQLLAQMNMQTFFS